MKALVKTKFGADCMRLMEVPEPMPKEDEIKVKVYACGVCGTDIHIMHDNYKSEPPVTLGHEFSGYVTEVGENVHDFKVGDRVTSMTAVKTCGTCEWCVQDLRMLCPERKSLGVAWNGAFANYTVVPAKQCFKLPDTVPMILGALGEPLACCCRGVCERTSITAGDYVLVAGAGIMGQLTAQVAMANGGIVIMTGLKNDAERFRIAKEAGVFGTVYVDGEDPLGEILKLTGGEHPKIAFECSGVAASAQFCLQALKKFGYYTQIAIPGKPIPFDMDLALYKEITISNSYASERSSWKIALQLLENKLIRVDQLVGTIFPLEQWEAAFNRMIAKEDFKVFIKPNGEFSN